MLFTRDIVGVSATFIESSATNPEEFYLIGPQYFQIWKLNAVEKGLDEQMFNIQENLVKPDESIVECCQIPDTEYLAFVTNANTLYFYKSRKLHNTVQLVVSDIYIKEEQEKKSRNIMKNTSSNVALSAQPNSPQLPGIPEEGTVSKPSGDMYTVSALAPLFNGFIVGFENIGVLNAYEMNKKTEDLFLKATFRINQQHIHKVLNLSCSIQENMIVLTIQHSPRMIQALETGATKLLLNAAEKNNNPSTGNLNGTNNPGSSNALNGSQKDLSFFQQQSAGESGAMSPKVKRQRTQNVDGFSSLNPSSSSLTKLNSKKHPGQLANAAGNIAGNPRGDIQNMGRIDIYLFNYGVADVISATQKDAFEPLFPEGVHKGSVVDVSLCPSRSVLLTLSDDKTLKTWEFQTSSGVFKCNFTTYFHENPLSLSLNPLSFQCAVGFREGLKFFFLLEDELKMAFSDNNLKYCNAVCYSEWGNILAASNFNLINLYDSNTFECKTVLNGHSGLVKKIKWLQDDTMLASNCSQGVFNCWNVGQGTRIVEHAYKQLKYNACAYDTEFDWCVCCTTDSKVKLFDDKGQNPIYDLDVSPFVFTCVLLVKELGVIFFGTSAGSVRSYQWPFDISLKVQEFFELTLHQTPVSSMQITKDMNYLITGAENGSLYFLKLRQFSNGNEVEIQFGADDDKFGVGSIYCLNLLCSSSIQSQENKKDLIKELEFRISNLKTDQEDEKEKQVNQINMMLKTQEEENKDQISKQKEQLSKIMEDCDQKYKDLISQIETLRSKYREEVSSLEEKNMDSLLTEYQKSDELKQNLEGTKEFSSSEFSEITSKYKRILKETDQDFNRKFQELFDRYSRQEDKCSEDQRKFKEVFDQTKDEHNENLERTKKLLMEEKEEEIRRSEELRTSNSKKQKEIERFNQRKLELDSILKEASNQIEHLEEEREHFNDKNLLMQGQLQGKEEIINSKEQEIKEFRVKNNHLQNFKTVYDYQVTSLQDERTPLIDHFKSMEKNVRVMYKELLDESEAAKKINLKLNENNESITNLKDQMKSKQDILAITKRKIESFEYEILKMISQDPYEKWYIQMKAIHKDFFEGDVSVSNLMEKNTSIGSSLKDAPDEELMRSLNMNSTDQIREELIKQRDFMSKKIQTISRLNKQTEIDRDDVVIRVQNENTHLIRECNVLREEKQNLKEHLKSLEKALDIVTKELMRLSLNSEIAEDQEFFEKELMEFDPSKIIDKLDGNKSSLFVEQSILDSPKPKLKKITNTKTPYQKYDEERTQRLAKQQSALSLSSITHDGSILSGNGQKDNQNLLTNLLKDVERYKDDQDSNVYDRLKERVQNYLYTEDPSLTIPHISRIDKTTMLGQSQENTQIAQNSIISESLNMTKSQPDILAQLKAKGNDSILSNKKHRSMSKKIDSKSTFTLPQIKKSKF